MTNDKSIQQNISDRRSAELLYRQAGELLAPEVRKLTPSAQRMFWDMMSKLCWRATATLNNKQTFDAVGKLHRQQPSNPPATSPRKIKVREPSTDVETALQLCEAIEEMAGEVPERGADFAESVRAKAADIAATIEERDAVTEAQMSALENMHAGLCRWIER